MRPFDRLDRVVETCLLGLIIVPPPFCLAPFPSGLNQSSRSQQWWQRGCGSSRTFEGVSFGISEAPFISQSSFSSF